MPRGQGTVCHEGGLQQPSPATEREASAGTSSTGASGGAATRTPVIGERSTRSGHQSLSLGVILTNGRWGGVVMMCRIDWECICVMGRGGIGLCVEVCSGVWGCVCCTDSGFVEG